MAEIISPYDETPDPESPYPPGRGPASRLGDEPLRIKRVFLHSLFGYYWCDVGPGLESLKDRSDVPRVLHPLAGYHDDPFVDVLLLELNDSDIDEVRTRLGIDESRFEKLEKLRLELGAMGQVPQDSNDVVKRVFTPEEFLDASRLLRICRAFVSQEELTRFCESRRYEINPLNVANSQAGVPAVNWRQSMKRCLALQKDERLDSSNDVGQFGAFKLISSLVCYIDRRVESGADLQLLVQSASKWLRNVHSEFKVSLGELKKHRTELLQAVETGYLSRRPMKERPRVIAREYFRLLQNRGTRSAPGKDKAW